MDCRNVLLPLLLLLAAAAADAAAASAASDAVNLTRKVGEDVTLSLGDRLLKHGDMLVWSNGTGDVLFNIDIGDYNKSTKGEKFDLDLTTGALTIKQVKTTDSTIYRGQIINGNGINRYFNLTVKGPDGIQPIQPIHPTQPIQPTAEPQQHANTGIIIGAVAAAAVLICLLVAFIMKKKKNICSDDGVV